jgi:hypothetical protein
MQSNQSNASNQTTERVTLFIPPNLNTDIRIEAIKQRKSISAVAIEAFQQYLKSQNDKTEAVA